VEPQREIELSPAEFLADGEQPVTERSPDPRVGEGSPQVVAVRREAGKAVSVGRFRHLVRDAGPLLVDAHVNAVDGSSRRTDRGSGTMWISLTSSWGHGRLVRNADGSADLSAVRSPDGVTVVDEHHDHVEVDDLQRLIEAIGRPPRQPTLRHPPALDTTV
jgi:hypothetical protein